MRVLTLALAFVLMVPAAARAADMLYVSLDNNTVVRYDISLSTAQAVASSRQVFANTNMVAPQGMAFDSTGNFYVANVFGNTISKFDSTGQFLTSIGSSQNLNKPRGLVIDASGNIYTANWSASNSISKFNSSGTYVTSFTGLSRPIGLAFDSAGFLYAANDSGWISKFNSSGTEVFSISGNLAAPNGLAFDSAGNLYAANYAINSVSKFDSTGGFLTSIGSSPDLANPTGVAIDSFGNLYVANTGGGSISKFNSAGQFLFKWSTDAGAAPGFLLSVPVVVPEPSSYILGTLAALALAVMARRQRRVAHRPECV